MVSKKLKDNIHGAGLWAEYGHPQDDYIAAVRDDLESNCYVISFHKGRMPAFNSKTIATLEELETEMRKVQPDMRKWKQPEC